MQISTTIVTGFIGSGKTTIISHLIDTLQARGEQVVFVKNEVGDADIDAALLQGKHIKTQELLNGCICCTLIGPFISAIDELLTTVKADRIIVEASGAANTASLALMVSGHPKLKRDGVIAIIDVLNFQGFAELSTTTRDQARFTDLLVFNKVELADLAQKQRVVGYVREVNETAPIVEAPGGYLHPDLAFGITSAYLDQLLSVPVASSEHIHQDAISGFHLPVTKPLTAEKLTTWLANLPATLFRIKGIIPLTQPGGDVAWFLLNSVQKRVTLDPIETPITADQAKLIFIGYQAEKVQARVTSDFHTLTSLP